MALTTVTIPVGFQPIAGNPFLFVFNESTFVGKVNYRVEIELWDLDTGLILLNGLKFSFSADQSTGVINCYLETPCRRLLDFSKVGSLTSVQKLTGHFKNIFIKYQAVWDAASDPQVSLAGSPACIFNAIKHMETDWDGIYPLTYSMDDTSYGGELFLQPLTKLQAWTSKPCFLDALILQSSLDNRLYISDRATGSDRTGLGFWTVKETKRSIHGFSWSFPSAAAGASLQAQMSFGEVKTAMGAAPSGSYDLAYGVGAITSIAQLFTMTSANKVAFNLQVVAFNTPGSYRFEVYNTAGNVPTTLVAGYTRTLKTGHHVSATGIDMVIEFYNAPGTANLVNGTKYALVITPVNDGINNAFNFLRFILDTGAPYANGNFATFNAGWTADLTKDMVGSFCQNTGFMGFSALQIDIRDGSLMQNLVPLTWLSDLGGRVMWGFDWSQDYGYLVESDRRGPTSKLYAISLLPAEWKMINELNKNGARYSDYKKLGQRVIDLNQLAAYQDVYVLPTLDVYKTSSIRTNTQVNIQYKELPQNRISQ